MWWHNRHRHVREKGLIELEKNKLLNSNKLNKLEFCDQCVLGKSHKVNFSSGIHVLSRPFEYVHSDFWRPSKVKTLGGGSCFLTMIDDYSRRV
jgi:5'-3' exoribonuclease 2